MSRPPELLMRLVRGQEIDATQVDRSMLQSAVEHRVAGLLLEAVRDSRDLDDKVLLALIALDTATKRHQKLLNDVVESVHLRLSDRGISHTLIKGFASARRWFEEESLRPFADIDLVVPQGDQFAFAAQLLDPSHPKLPLLESGLLTSLDFVIDDVPVDLQTDALRMKLAPLDSSWSEGTSQLSLGRETNINVLDAEHDLVVFLLHYERDRFRYLQGLVEADGRLSQVIDWATVEAIARREGIWEQVAIALEVVCEELQRPNPVNVPRNWRTWMWRRLWDPGVRLQGEVTRARYIFRAQFLMPLTMRGRFSDALRWLGHKAFPPDVILRHQYPNAHGPYLWRVVTSRVQIRRSRRSWVQQQPNQSK